MNIKGNDIEVFAANDEWIYSSVQTFLKNKKFSFLNICSRGFDKFNIYYILADEEFFEKNEKVSI